MEINISVPRPLKIAWSVPVVQMWRRDGTSIRQEGEFTIITSTNGLNYSKRPKRLRDTDHVIDRKQRNIADYAQMEKMLKLLTAFTKHHLLNFAKALAEKKGIRIDRAAMRQKVCLICWFCENCPELLAHHQPLPAPQPATADSSGLARILEWDDPDWEVD